MKKPTPPNQTRSGFTMVEFMLVTAAIAALSIAIAIIINSISTIYQKGLALKAVNSVGRGLIDEFTNGINAAPSVDTISLCRGHLTSSIDACIQDKARNFVYQDRRGSYTFPNGGGIHTVQYGGIFCTGNYSYIWNTFYGLKTGNTLTLTYNLGGAGGGSSIETTSAHRLLRITDPTYRVCSSVVGNNYTSTLPATSAQNINITTLANGSTNITRPAAVTGFLRGFDLDLDLYELTVFPISQSLTTFRTFFAGAFTIATDKGDPNITRTGDYCNIQNDSSAADFATASDFDYCGINKFNFAARTAGK